MIETALFSRIAELLPRYAYRFTDEISLHEAIAHVLTGARIAHQREFVAGPADRFDFLIEPGIVIEAKIKGSLPTALRQIARYAARDDVTGIVLVSTRFWGNVAMPESINGKPTRLVRLRGDSF